MARLEDVLLVIELNPTIRNRYFSGYQKATIHDGRRLIEEVKLRNDN